MNDEKQESKIYHAFKWLVKLIGDRHTTSELYILYIILVAQFLMAIPLENLTLQNFLFVLLLIVTAKLNLTNKFRFLSIMALFFANIGVIWLAKLWFYVSLLNLLFTIIREVEKW